MRSPTPKQIDVVVGSVLACACHGDNRRGHHQDRADGFQGGWCGHVEPDYIQTRKLGAVAAFRLGQRVGAFLRRSAERCTAS